VSLYLSLTSCAAACRAARRAAACRAAHRTAACRATHCAAARRAAACSAACCVAACLSPCHLSRHHLLRRRMSYHLAVLQQLAKLAHTAQCIALLLLVPLRHGRSCRRIAVARAGVCTCRDRSCRRVYRCVVVADAAVCAAMSWSLVPACALPCVPAYRGRSCRRVHCRVRHRVMVAHAGVCAAMCASVSWLLMPVCALPCAPLCRGCRC
jgi:hypothetical protein